MLTIDEENALRERISRLEAEVAALKPRPPTPKGPGYGHPDLFEIWSVCNSRRGVAHG